MEESSMGQSDEKAYGSRGEQYKVHIELTDENTKLRIAFIEQLVGKYFPVVYSSSFEIKNLPIKMEEPTKIVDFFNWELKFKMVKIEKKEDKLETTWQRFEEKPIILELTKKKEEDVYSRDISKLKGDVEEIKKLLLTVIRKFQGVEEDKEKTPEEGNNDEMQKITKELEDKNISDYGVDNLKQVKVLSDANYVCQIIILSDNRILTSSTHIICYNPLNNYSIDFRKDSAHGGNLITGLLEVSYKNNELIIASGGQDSQLRIWKNVGNSLNEIVHFPHQSYCHKLIHFDDQAFISTTCQTIRFWDKDTYNCSLEVKDTINAHIVTILKLKQKPMFVTGTYSTQHVAIRDNKTGLPVYNWDGEVNFYAYFNDGFLELAQNRLLIAGIEKVAIMNLDNYNIILRIYHPNLIAGNCIRNIIKFKGKIICGTQVGDIHIIEHNNKFMIKKGRNMIQSYFISSLRNWDDRYLLVGGYQKLQIYELNI